MIGDNLRGVDNCSVDPNCLTRRIVDNRDPMRGTDFIPVPDQPRTGAAGSGGAAGGGAADGGGAGGGAGADRSGGSAGVSGAAATADAEDDAADAAPVCTPRPAGRIAPDFAQIDLPAGTIGANPHHEHLTGLESWFWYDGPTTLTWTSPVFVGVAADCSVVPAPQAATYRADLVAYLWRVDDSRPGRYHAHRPGSEDQPAARHTYQTKGRWSVTVDCTWQGAWGAQVTIPCGRRDLDVIEVRSRLRHD